MKIDATAEASSVVPAADPAHWLGAMEGTGQIAGDIVSPASDERDWNALSEDRDEVHNL